MFYDDRLTGFGLRVMPSGLKTWFIEYRPGHGGRGVSKRKFTLGRDSDAFRADAARDRARTELARVALGHDPAAERTTVRQAETVAQLMAAYMDDVVRPKRKPGTIVLFDGFIDNHVVPAIGARKSLSITHADVRQLHRAIGAKHKVTANRVVTLLGSAYAHAERTGLIPDGTKNPTKRVERYPEQARERYLTGDEFARLGETLRLAETSGIPCLREPARKVKGARRGKNRRVAVDADAVAAIRLLMFTGCRLREILHLEWRFVDLGRGLLFLPDSKTGRKTVVLGAAALAVLQNLPKAGPFVIPRRTMSGQADAKHARADLKGPWARITEHARLPGLRLHDLRHSFASVGVGAGMGLPIIGKLLGHANSATTARYAHLDAHPLRTASNAINATILDALAAPAVRDPEIAELVG